MCEHLDIPSVTKVFLNMPKRILVISEYIAPVNAVAAIRWTKLIKYLAKNHGYSVDVLTNEKDFTQRSVFKKHYPFDVTLCDDAESVQNTYIIPTTVKLAILYGFYNFLSSIKKVQKIVKAKMPAWYRQSKQIRSSPDLRLGQSTSQTLQTEKIVGKQSNKISYSVRLQRWFERVFQQGLLKSGISMELDYSCYDVIISSYGPLWTHLLAHAIKLQNPGIVWIPDFRDQLRDSETLTYHDCEGKLHSLLSDAAMVCATGTDILVSLHLIPTQKYVCIPNGFDPSDIDHCSRTNSPYFEICYTGTLYDNGEAYSDITPLLDVLEELISQGIVNPENLRVVYAGNCSDKFLKQMASYGEIPFEDKGFVSRTQALSLQAHASLLVLLAWNTHRSQGIATAKIYEYFFSGVPVVGICTGDKSGSLVKDMLKKAAVGVCYEQACANQDRAALVEFVAEKYHQWQKTRLTKNLSNESYISSFKYSNLAKNFNEVIENLIREYAELHAGMDKTMKNVLDYLKENSKDDF